MDRDVAELEQRLEAMQVKSTSSVFVNWKFVSDLLRVVSNVTERRECLAFSITSAGTQSRLENHCPRHT